ncbi:hypothetical protein [Candidatus Methanoperedens sp. BLZ2]|uniref:hypothetical protein n=1 Tax=Candidatus Methanoperedens sp. BLZ2 TaxID=2035255 RepID=UPI0011439AE5|nr:hypothetical protein [Candidatus Methanoperedens sp. BLZ2]KAB2946437.1 MAG: hypothetical protein F9K14_07580 [Candidatus Methanoperedens sp.]MBZ0175673.1 hypothetical protein [Candidatus Methanoperedens nitroreducens]
MKAHELNTVSDNAKMFCDQVDSLAGSGRLPSWLVGAIKITIKPIILKGMVEKEINFEAIRGAWKIPANMRYIPQYERYLKC